MSQLNNEAVALAKHFKKLPKNAYLSFDRFTMRHSAEYENNRASHPCGCYYCQKLHKNKLEELKLPNPRKRIEK